MPQKFRPLKLTTYIRFCNKNVATACTAGSFERENFPESIAIGEGFTLKIFIVWRKTRFGGCKLRQSGEEDIISRIN